MRILQINTSVNYGSTGSIAEGIANLFLDKGHESYIAYGRIQGSSRSKLLKIGDKNDIYKHGLQSFFFDKHGLGSKSATLDFVKKLDKIKPDIIGLHNIHGYYLNYTILFEYIKQKNISVLWTLHDCWPFTGHCSYFDSVSCKKWKTHCQKCPLTTNYPKAIIDRSFQNFEDKKNAFLGVENIKIITPSHWLERLVKQSFLKDYPLKVIHNGVDTDVFKPLDKVYNPNQKIVLGVASTWDKRKGLNDFIQLRKELSSQYKIVLIGLSIKQIKSLPEGITGIKRTENIEALVKWYNKATVFVNPTYVDNFPTTNLEALACGTPIITYNSGGSPEAVLDSTSKIIEKGNIAKVAKAIQSISKSSKDIKECRQKSLLNFNAKDRFLDYYNIFLKLKKDIY